MLQLFEEDELDWDADVGEENDQETQEEDTKGDKEAERSQTSLYTPPGQLQPGLESLLDNPSIQVYPQRPELVQLQSVQNLSTVFDQMYDAHQPEEAPNPARTLPRRPRPSYIKYR